MRNLLIVLSILSLLITVTPPVLVYKQVLSAEENKLWMTIGTLGWFLTAPFWIKAKNVEQ